ncbi:MAG: GspE/PulE family protein [Microcystaceae cyanobacterium]
MSSHLDRQDPSESANTALTNELIQSGYLTIPQMQQALIESRKSGRSLLDILPKITGKSLPPEIISHHQQQHLFTLKIIHGVEYFNPSMEVDRDKIAKIIEKLGILELCYRHKILPLKLQNHKPPILKMLMVDPSHTEMLDELKHRLERKGVKLRRFGITLEDYQQLAQTIYPKLDGSEQIIAKVDQAADQTIVDVTEVFEEMPPALAALHPMGEQEEDTDNNLSLDRDNDGEDAPIIKLVNKILIQALENKASAIHLTPQENLLTVQFRQDGILQAAFDPLSKHMAPAVISRLKVMAELDVTQELHLQKGKIIKQFGGRSVAFHLNISPSRTGEKAVIKVVDNYKKTPPLSELFHSGDLEPMVDQLLKRSSGLLIVTGTDLSGKSSTLNALITQKSQQGLSIVTLEDPIERTLANVTQVEINTAQERTYSKVLQSLARQDVDVIGVDRIENEEIAHSLVDMAASGRYVIASLTAATIPDAIAQLKQLGIPASRLSDTLIGIINQRLVRCLCPTCRLSYELDSRQLGKFGLKPAQCSHINFYKANALSPTAAEQARAKGRLCRTCNGKGYRGQTGIYELFTVTPSLKALISQNADPERLIAVATQEGMLPLLSNALTLVQQGETTLEEIETVLDKNLLTTPSSDSHPTSTSDISVMKRIETIEQLLLTLTREVEQLKQSLDGSEDGSSVTVEAVEKAASFQSSQQSSVPQKQQDIPEEVNLYEQTIAYGETIASSDALYEELNDPGDWDALKQELDPNKETMAINFSDTDGENEDEEKIPDFNPFNSVPDPWSS